MVEPRHDKRSPEDEEKHETERRGKPVSVFHFSQNLVVVPKRMRKQIIRSAHTHPLSGHSGYDSTMNRILHTMFWPDMKDIKEFVDHCEDCLRAKDPHHFKKYPLTPWSRPSGPNQRIHVDLCGPFKTANGGSNYVLAVTDAYSKFKME